MEVVVELSGTVGDVVPVESAGGWGEVDVVDVASEAGPDGIVESAEPVGTELAGPFPVASSSDWLVDEVPSPGFGTALDISTVVVDDGVSTAPASAANTVAGMATEGLITWLRTWATAPHASPKATTAAKNQPTASFIQLGTEEVSHAGVWPISTKG